MPSVTLITYFCPNVSGWSRPLGSQEVITQRVSSAIFKTMGPRNTGVTTLTFVGHVTRLVTWPFDSPGAISYRCSIVTESLSPAIFGTMSPKHIGVTTVIFSRSRDVIGHVTNWSATCHFLLVSHWNRTSISNWVKYIWVTTLTFLFSI